ncbi:MAG: DUF2806 domain-containing protein [Lachnospiraceae bacterium]|nr:DUF2806 domain-containing protein [Lachnospiraceae bacterium]
MNEYNIVNFGSMTEHMAKVINHLIDKISNAIGWSIKPKEFEQAVIDANRSLLEEISKREDVNPIERAAIINNFKRYIKEYENQLDVINIAIKHLNSNAKPDEVEEDWIVFFFDKIKLVNEEEMKIIWGKILAGEVNEPNTYTKQFLHTISIMDSKMAKRFLKIRSNCFFIPPKLYMFVYRSNSDNIDNGRRYQQLGISYKDIRELDNIGLIQYRHPKFFTIKKSYLQLFYGDNVIELHAKNNIIETGNVSLTDIGKQLCRICQIEYDDNILDICLDTWKYLGYNPIVKKLE